MPSDLWLADTNILLRWLQPEGSDFPIVVRGIRRVECTGATLCFTGQNMAEFWNVLTRPVDRNGYGISPAEADVELGASRLVFDFCPIT